LLISPVGTGCTTINVAQLSTLGTVSLPETTQATPSSDQAEIQDTNRAEIEKTFLYSQVSVNPKWTNPEVLQLLILYKANDEKCDL
jgi:hypothetical protein